MSLCSRKQPSAEARTHAAITAPRREPTWRGADVGGCVRKRPLDTDALSVARANCTTPLATLEYITHLATMSSDDDVADLAPTIHLHLDDLDVDAMSATE